MKKIISFLALLALAVLIFADTKNVTYDSSSLNTSPTNINLRVGTIRTYGDGSSPGAIDLYSSDLSKTLSLEIHPSATASINLRAPAAPFNGISGYTNTSGSTNMVIQQAVYVAGADQLADDTYSGIPLVGRVAGETLTQWDLVRLHTDGKWYKADADGGAFPAFTAKGIAVSAASTDGLVAVLTEGVIRNDGWTWTTVGGFLYLSITAGGMTQTAPSTTGNAVQVVGYALSDDEAYIRINQVWSLAP
jgi:hypothetical protein